MTNLSIQLTGGSLDIFVQDVEWSWTAFRFAEGLRDQYSTDISIPKTPNNMGILEVSGLMDSDTQLFGDRISPCVLVVNGVPVESYLQVAEITEDDIKICLYESTLPREKRDIKMSRLATDDWSTIRPWNVNTVNWYPDEFLQYGYGMTYNANYAQYHPSKPLSAIMQKVEAASGITVQTPQNNYYVMATKKTVCPQNNRQAVEGALNDGEFKIKGGQHVTNDLSFNESEYIEFNRSCHVDMTVWLSWRSKNDTNGQNTFFNVKQKRNGQWISTANPHVYVNVYKTYVDKWSFAFDMEEGDQLWFTPSNLNYYQMCTMVADMTITGYDVTEDDYGSELEYTSRLPRVWVLDYSSGQYFPKYFHGGSVTYYYETKSQSDGHGQQATVQITNSSFSYFGYWCNLPEMTVGKFLGGLAWLFGMKPRFSNGVFEYADPDESAVLDNFSITSLRPVTDRLGRNNRVRFDNEENPANVSTVKNMWLETERDIYVSPFGKTYPWGTHVGKAYQYSNPEYDEESGEYSCDFEDAGFLVWDKWKQNGMTVNALDCLPMHTFGLEKLTQAMEATIETYGSDIKDRDYVYANGKKFMVVEGSTDLNTGKSTITALLVPTAPSSHVIPFTPYNHI